MNKKNLILGGILLALVAFTWVWNGPVKNWNEKRTEEKNFLSSLSMEKVSRISFERASSTTALEKSADKWRVGGTKDFYAKKEAIDELIFALQKAAKEKFELTSANQDKKAGFGTDDKGIKVKIEQEGQAFEFIVGNATANFDGSYISLAAEPKTWKVGVDLSGVFSRGEWRDDQIFSFLKERVSKVRFQYPNRQFIVENKAGKWEGNWPKKFPVNGDKMVKILETLESLKAAKIPAQDFKGTGLEKHSIIVQVTGEGSLDETLMVGDCTKDNLCYAKKGSSDNIYMITKEQRDALNKQTKDLK